jgi:hypothetical protein
MTERGRAEVTRRLRASVVCLARGDIHADGQLGDPDPVQAIADALHVFPADEILIVTAPSRPSTWLHQNVIDRARRTFPRSIEQVVIPSAPGQEEP